MADVPDQTVARRIEDVVNGGGQFDDTEAGAEMSAGYRYGIDGLLAQFVRDLAHLLHLELAQVIRGPDRVEERRLTVYGHGVIPVLHVGMSSDEKRLRV